MADRLKLYLIDFIHTDQNGFLPRRHIKNNIRVILDILEHYEQHNEKQLCLIFIDAQKAFDNVKWDFIYNQLLYMDFGQKFINMFRAIYSKQKAKIIINDDTTENFQIKKGTRQGCPLSPLLFILSLEVLTRIIRSDDEIKGLQIKKEKFKIQAFADDLVFIIEEPLHSGIRLLEVLTEYGDMAGLKINKEKTKMMLKNINKTQERNLIEKLGIQTTKKIKYLGIHITNRCSTLKKNNYDELIQKIERDLDSWTKLQLSLMGRIAVLKMNVLPRILFLFQCIPIKTKKNLFQNLNKITTKFIWQKKKARIKLKLMQDSKERGGFGVPDWEKYYEAAMLTWIKDWVQLKNKRILQLEGYDLQSGWHNFLWEGKAKNHTYFKRHYVRGALLEVWTKIKRKHYIQLPNWISPLEMITHPNFIHLDNMVTYKQLINEEGELKSKRELQEENIKLEWWAYLQIQSKLAKDKKEPGIKKEETELDKILCGKEENLIKKIYAYLLEQALWEEQVKETMIKWGRDLGHSIDLDTWQNLWLRNSKITLAASYKENQYKMFYRWHLTPIRLAKINQNISSICWKCQKTAGTYYHMWWECNKAQKYWEGIRDWIQEILAIKLNLKPELFLLGLTKEKYDKDVFYLLIHILTAARISYGQNWKKERIPTEEEILDKILTCAEMDRLTLKLKDKTETKYYETWNKLYKWMENKGRKY